MDDEVGTALRPILDTAKRRPPIVDISQRTHKDRRRRLEKLQRLNVTYKV